MNRERSVIEYRRRINMAIDLINANLANDLTLEQIAQATDFSPFHFHRIFKGMLGENVAEFTRRLRLVRAKRMLVFDRSRSITDVAMECGFSSSQSFAKAFRKAEQVSPSDYRRDHPYGLIDYDISKNGHIDSNAGNDLYWPWPYARQTLSQGTKRFVMDVEIMEMPERTVAYLRRFGAYGPEIGTVFQQLMAWAAPQGLIDEQGETIAIYWDNPEETAAEKCRSDACLVVQDDFTAQGPVAVQTLPGGLYAVAHLNIAPDQFGQAWDQFVGEWLPSSGYQPDERPCFELYGIGANPPGCESFSVALCTSIKPL